MPHEPVCLLVQMGLGIEIRLNGLLQLLTLKAVHFQEGIEQVVVLSSHGYLVRPRDEEDKRIPQQDATGEELVKLIAPLAMLRESDHVHSRKSDSNEGTHSTSDEATNEGTPGTSGQVTVTNEVVRPIHVPRLVDPKFNCKRRKDLGALRVNDRAKSYCVGLEIKPFDGPHCQDVSMWLDENLRVDRCVAESVLLRELCFAVLTMRCRTVHRAPCLDCVVFLPPLVPVNACEDLSTSQTVKGRQQRKHRIEWLHLVSGRKAMASI
mmetsp:Transcript_99801/g.277899  ORF Transcript_99801/g.277899 Transcript_99801/m.277899 type:complete len:265 (-) Transcript_99801:883-1677(-)